MAKAKAYSLTKGLGKALAMTAVFAIPLLIDAFPAWANLTLGGVLTLGVNFLKVKYYR